MALLLSTGCGETVVDGDKVEDAIEQSASDAGLSGSVKEVDCPDREKSETGHRFDCTLTRSDGGKEAIPVEVTDGEEGTVSFGSAVR